uniref:Uncharacterized protein n=1 Tax=Anguilla anguilla TaxID=7936 RepID=A0A0E9X512_ANGAN
MFWYPLNDTQLIICCCGLAVKLYTASSSIIPLYTVLFSGFVFYISTEHKFWLCLCQRYERNFVPESYYSCCDCVLLCKWSNIFTANV